MNTVSREAFEPASWLLIFNHESATWWRSFLAFGRFKHVWACAYVPGVRSWLVYDVHLDWTTLGIVPAGPQFVDFLRARNSHPDTVTILSMPRQPPRGKLASPLILLRRIGFWCVPAMAHLIGVRCSALRPDAFYRACLRLGARPLEALDEPEVRAKAA